MESQVYHAWQAYYDSKQHDLIGQDGAPSSLWAPDEEVKWPMYDLAGYYVPADAKPNVISVKQIPGTGIDRYEIAIRFDTSVPDPSGVLTATWLVTRVGTRWQIGNVLPERTASWFSATVGQIHYVVEPGLTFDRARATRAVAFVDSLALAFGVPRLGPLDYYVTSSVDAADSAIGVAYTTRFGPAGGFAKPVNGQLFSGVPAWGENYRHELAHLVLRPLLNPGTLTILASEGIATWLGGTSGSDWPTPARTLQAYLVSHPKVTLDSAVTPGALPQTETYVAGAVLSEMTAKHGGAASLKAFLSAGPGPQQLRNALTRILGESWDQISSEWRHEVDRLSGG